jgi:hypothetical protein
MAVSQRVAPSGSYVSKDRTFHWFGWLHTRWAVALTPVCLAVAYLRYNVLTKVSVDSYTSVPSLTERRVENSWDLIAKCLHLSNWSLRMEFVGSNQRHDVANIIAAHITALPTWLNGLCALAICAIASLIVVNLLAESAPLARYYKLAAAGLGGALLLMLLEVPKQYVTIADRLSYLPDEFALKLAAHIGPISSRIWPDGTVSESELFNRVAVHFAAHGHGLGALGSMAFTSVTVLLGAFLVLVQNFTWFVAMLAGAMLLAYTSDRIRYHVGTIIRLCMALLPIMVLVALLQLSFTAVLLSR